MHLSSRAVLSLRLRNLPRCSHLPCGRSTQSPTNAVLPVGITPRSLSFHAVSGIGLVPRGDAQMGFLHVVNIDRRSLPHLPPVSKPIKYCVFDVGRLPDSPFTLALAPCPLCLVPLDNAPSNQLDAEQRCHCRRHGFCPRTLYRSSPRFRLHLQLET